MTSDLFFPFQMFKGTRGVGRIVRRSRSIDSRDLQGRVAVDGKDALENRVGNLEDEADGRRGSQVCPGTD